MHWPENSVRGFALAATIADDPGAKLAALAMAPSVVEQATRIAIELAILAPRERRQRVRALAELAAPLRTTRPINEQFIRADYKPEPALREMMRRIADNATNARR